MLIAEFAKLGFVVELRDSGNDERVLSALASRHITTPDTYARYGCPGQELIE